ncbi:SMC-Scp complex subunit ScpB (plasmid) [Nitratireductor sp. GISD-1A_MAKvit]|uniref:SMC-Scp complex subunit ScpB n=1 Tax=Nitratireductor sp. GISD-1A_MAKvit TaxID=3234198 RepID=UPI003467290D
MSVQSGRHNNRAKEAAPLFDRELEHLPPHLRWREWMARVEAVIFAAPEPVTRQTLAQVIGRDCNLDLLIEDIRAELVSRPYELVKLAGGWHHRTRPAMADAIRTAFGIAEKAVSLSESEALVLMAIGYFQPITRGELSRFFAREISRDVIGKLRRADFIASGPRSPQPGAPYTYVTTSAFLAHFGFDTLRDLPDFEKLEDAGLLNRERLLEDADGLAASFSG